VGARIAYRQFHDQTNVAVATLVVLAEFGLIEFDTSRPRQELTLHGLLQRGLYEEDRGKVLRNALRYLSVAGLNCNVLHDVARTGAVETRIKRAAPDFSFRFFRDLKAPGEAAPHLDAAFSGDARLLLVESRPALHTVPVHVLLARRDGDLCYVMNSHTGRDHVYGLGQVATHLTSPVAMGAVSFAGLLYLYTGIAVRIVRQ
jgi:hypothetical protein